MKFDASLFRLFLVALFIGLLAGISSAVFLLSLDFITSWRIHYSLWYYTMPVLGIGVVWLYLRTPSEVTKGNNALIEYIHNTTQKVPWLMAPVIYVTTIASHLGGASVGREGTAVQMSGSLASILIQKFSFSDFEKKSLMISALAAGFSGVFGTPWAGALFAMEVPAQGKFQWKAILPTLLASWVAHGICLCFPVSHTHYAVTSSLEWNFSTFASLIAASLVFALLAVLYLGVSDGIKKMWDYGKVSPYVRVLIAGVLMSGYFLYIDSRCAGLGIAEIQSAFRTSSVWYLALVKLVLTAFSLQSGFKGGEVTPLFFIGAVGGSAMCAVLPLPTPVLAAIGFVAVFAACTKTPLTSIVLGLEMFGFGFWPALLLVVLLSVFVSGSDSLYSSQSKSNRIYFFSLNTIWTKFSAKK